MTTTRIAHRLAPPLLLLGGLAAQQFHPYRTRAAFSLMQPFAGMDHFAVDDVNGDGSNEVLVVRGDIQVVILFEFAAGPRSRATLLPTTTASAGRFVDLDGDADPDVLVAPDEPGQPGVVWVVENVAGQLQAVGALPGSLTSTPAERALPVDVDGDGDRDLIVSTAGTGQTVRLFRNLGGLTFQLDAAATPAAGLPSACWTDAIDFDRDGDLDVLASAPGSAFVLLQNDGTGTFTAASASLPPARTGHRWLAVADLDGDGNDDAVAAWSTGAVDVLWGTGAGAFTFQADVATGLGARRVDPADADGDGDPELVVRSGGGAWLLRHGGGRQFAAAAIVADGIEGAGVGDLDGDGGADFLFATTEAVRVKHRCEADLEDIAWELGFEQLAAAGQPVHAALVGDVDGDGLPDVLQPTTTGIVVQHAMSAGRYRATLTAPASQMNVAEWFRLADMDGDADLDLVHESFAGLGVWVNDGTGAFSARHSVSEQGVSGADASRVGDVDGDGDLDVVRSAAVGLRLYRNTGTALQAVTLLPWVSISLAAPCLELVDVDGDGDLDIVTGLDGPTGDLVALANDGTGGFTPTAAIAVRTAGGRARAMVGADLDGDGDVDLAMGTSGLELHLNDGAGNFRFANPGRLPPGVTTVSSNLVAEDLDGDGDRDLLFWSSTSARLLVNDGTAAFLDLSRSRWSTPDAVIGQVGSGDIDLDGDLDVVLGAAPFAMLSPQRVVVNHLRQCVSRQVARLGGSFVIDTYSGPGIGAPGLSLLVGATAATGPVAIPGIVGLVQVDPAASRVLAMAPMSVVGVSSTHLPVPVAPPLVGLRLWFQQLTLPQAGAPGVSNLVEERVLP